MQSDQSALFTGASIAVLFTIFVVASLIGLLPMIFYSLTLQKALNRCAPENRAMAPGLVWLMLVPLFNIVWNFFVVINLAKSLGAEFQKRGIAEEPKPGKKLGLTMCILSCCGVIPFLGILCTVGALVCWIIYWVKIAGFSAKIA